MLECRSVWGMSSNSLPAPHRLHLQPQRSHGTSLATRLVVLLIAPAQLNNYSGSRMPGLLRTHYQTDSGAFSAQPSFCNNFWFILYTTKFDLIEMATIVYRINGRNSMGTRTMVVGREVKVPPLIVFAVHNLNIKQDAWPLYYYEWNGSVERLIIM